MKQIKLFFFILLFPLTIYAQCKECQNQDEDNWKLAAGITLFSNQDYNPSWLPAPYEINFKYRAKQHHILRAMVPLNIKPYGFPKTNDYTPKDVDIVDYYHYLKENIRGGITFQEYTKGEKKIYGAIIGYEYEYPIIQNLVAFAGLDLGYFYQSLTWNYRFTYIDSDENNNINITGANEIHYDAKFNTYRLKPFIGLRYKFQRLFIEGGLGYSYTQLNPSYYDCYDKSVSGYYINSEYQEYIKTNTSEFSNSAIKQLSYNVSLYYSF